ncbi:transcription termination factor Rho [Corynebacterium imitans]|uniref:transcription termination factor Rho n=1 Tax=Corynebacterium imitans TaxID=156978 RepID=UPI00254E2411|nr:transcription termination factor Rho [Corynebacterium imitans]MDK8305977.1 transcription termination factor Rho [Corynebacterium imitans]MDK8636918.1 transcription termination factor Rho [Corynebacterium imitans]MDK8772004.1 transcription termination factor Rho [Corynebacterium imitans]
MTDTSNAAATGNTAELSALKIPELRKIAAEKGLKGVSALRKGDLIQAIVTGEVPRKARAAAAEAAGDAGGADTAEQNNDAPAASQRRRASRRAAGPADGDAGDNANDAAPHAEDKKSDKPAKGDKPKKQDREQDSDHEGQNEKSEQGSQKYESRSAARRARRNRARHDNDQHGDNQHGDNQHGDHQHGDNEQDNGDNRGDHDNNRDKRDNNGGRNNKQNNRGGRNNNRDNNRDNNDDGNQGGRRGRRNRRNRNRNRDNQHNQQDNNQQLDPEELQEVAGIVDIVDNNAAFIRTTGYRKNNADVYVNQKLVRQNGLRAGDAVIGQVRQNGQGHSHGSGRNRQRYNQLVRVDSVNGMNPEEAKQRAEFHKLTPLYPNKRLRLETEPKILTTRVIDLVMPIGKGQRALIVSPPKAGKTTILQNIANAIATNNPECYLMVVLVDERPEEVTDMQRSVKGEVIASTFDRPPSEHTAVAELAIERAKRLVEMGQDVVVLLDSITRLGRAYNNSSPASGRILSGGVDSNALYPPKRFLGAARNIEEGGSLTIIATAMVETGSAGDTVIFEEFKGTGNAELKLDRKIAERRVFPAVDVNPSGTRKDELLMSPEEARVMHKLRRILSALDPQQSIDMLIKQLKKTKSNGEFLMGVANSAPMVADQDSEEYK